MKFLLSDEPKPGDMVFITDVCDDILEVTGTAFKHFFGKQACWRLPTTIGDVSYDGDASIHIYEEGDKSPVNWWEHDREFLRWFLENNKSAVENRIQKMKALRY